MPKAKTEGAFVAKDFVRQNQSLAFSLSRLSATAPSRREPECNFIDTKIISRRKITSQTGGYGICPYNENRKFLGRGRRLDDPFVCGGSKPPPNKRFGVLR